MEDLERLLPIQELDSELDRLHHRLEVLAERIAEKEALESWEAIKTEHDMAVEQLECARREHQENEEKLEALNAKIEEGTRVLYGGTITATRELMALQAEIESLDKHRSVLEEAVIESMLAIDDAEVEVQRCRERLDAAARRLEEARENLRSATAGIESEHDKVEKALAEARGTVGGSMALEIYDELRSKYGGVVVSKLEDGVCGSCRLKISTACETELRHGEGIPRCEHCSMILIP